MQKNNTKREEKKKIMPRFFKEPRASIVKVLIDELTIWKSTEKCTDEEILRLVDRLEKIKIKE